MREQRDIPLNIFTYVTTRNRGFEAVRHGLIFHNRQRMLSVTEQKTLMMHPDVEAVMGSHLYGFMLQRIIVTDGDTPNKEYPYFCIIAQPLNDHLRKNLTQTQPLYLRYETHLVKTSFNTRWHACRLMQKLIGCDRCSWRDDRCFLHDVPQEANERCGDDPYSDIDAHRFRDTTKNNTSAWVLPRTLAGFTYISPVMVCRNAVQPGASAPYITNVHLNALDIKAEELSERSQKAQKTKAFKRTECAKCVFATTGYLKRVLPCIPFGPTYCAHGAWTQEALVAYTLKGLTEKIKGSAFTLEDIWRVALLTHIPFKHVHPLNAAKRKRKVQWIVGRLAQAYDKPLSIQLMRTARAWRAERDAVLLYSMEELKTWLPPELWDWVHSEERGPFEAANLVLWFQVASAASCPSRIVRCGDYCFDRYSAPIHAVSLSETGAVTLHSLRSRDSFQIRFYTFNEVHAYFGCLPLFDIRQQECEPCYFSIRNRVR